MKQLGGAEGHLMVSYLEPVDIVLCWGGCGYVFGERKSSGA